MILINIVVLHRIFILLKILLKKLDFSLNS